MSAVLSSAKATTLLAEVQKNPEIGTNDATYVTRLVQQAAEDLVAHTNLPRYPELSQGYALSALGASEDITGLSTSELWVSVNGSDFAVLTLTLAGLNSGSAIASHLQSLIRAKTTDGFDEVSVSFAGSGATAQYTATSGRFGEGSAISFSFSENSTDVAKNLKLSKWFGGREFTGAWARDEADDAVVEMVEILYRKLGLEGIKNGTVPGDGGFTMYDGELSPSARRKIGSMRRFWT